MVRVFEFFDRVMYAQGVARLAEVLRDSHTDRFEWWWAEFGDMPETKIVEVLDSMISLLSPVPAVAGDWREAAPSSLPAGEEIAPLGAADRPWLAPLASPAEFPPDCP